MTEAETPQERQRTSNVRQLMLVRALVRVMLLALARKKDSLADTYGDSVSRAR